MHNTAQQSSTATQARTPAPTLANDLDRAIDTALDWSRQRQRPEGYWVGRVQTNSCMEAEWLMAFWFLGQEDDPRVAGLQRAILNEQRPDGAWEVYADAPVGDINATVECYAALRVHGQNPEAPEMRRARDWILQHGGLGKTRLFTRYWLALLDEWPWQHTANIPPEVIWQPRWSPFNVYRFASWARATLMPISVLSALRPSRRAAPERRLDELFPEGREGFDFQLRNPAGRASIEQLFLWLDKALHTYQRVGITPGRKLAVGQVLEWIVRHQDADGAWGGIQPPWIYSLIALNAAGYPTSHPVMAKGLEALNEHWAVGDADGALYVQASESPVWDTLLTMLAFQDCDVAFEHSGALQQATEWILDQQVDFSGDWAVRDPQLPSGGWAFERANLHYPDLDDTAVALISLSGLREDYPDHPRLERAIDRGRRWMLGMQSSNGGWAAFDRDNNQRILARIPFSDFGEALDPPSVDVTAHVLESLGLLGCGDDPAVTDALAYIRSEQEQEGCWFGRWGVNYIYGTSAVLTAVRALGLERGENWLQRAGEWLCQHQNEDGGWGETCGSYMDVEMRGVGPSTATQTAWALMGLIALGRDRDRDAVAAGVRYLLDTQHDGTWHERSYTGTGFPGYGLGEHLKMDPAYFRKRRGQGEELSRGFMLNYHLYRHYFPLMALGRARRWL